MNLFNKYLLTAALSTVAFASQSLAQYRVAPGKYAVKFTDKNNNGYSIDKPEEFLTQKALDRRAKYKIAIDEYDLPVNQKYVDSLKSMGIFVQGSSKWLNCAVIKADSAQLAEVAKLSFVEPGYKWCQIKPGIEKQPRQIQRPKIKNKNPLEDKHVYNYGDGSNQAKMLNIHKLHGLGYCGQGMTIAVLDAGFYKADELPCFVNMYEEGRVLGVRDFADNDSIVYDSDNHGMNVLSCIAGKWEGKLVGTAPESSAYLFRTEISSSENIIEEFLWAMAAETADSLGVDMIHSSLGYHDFDDDDVDYKYEQFDGNTTVASIAADRAASKGILVSISAGNEGDDAHFPWITSPADADSVFAVGAVDKNGKIAYFSSRGPAPDGRVKPDVCAQGVWASVQSPTGKITKSNGTSFAGPIFAGAALCLLQAHPNAPIMEVMDAIKASGSYYNKPDGTYGYGIPDFELAHKILLKKKL
ncbi:MAG: S8 family serine peptidase [Bacteroidales bacterium]|nr:S8 family serine peptidase [Bacteroidales bacterium]